MRCTTERMQAQLAWSGCPAGDFAKYAIPCVIKKNRVMKCLEMSVKTAAKKDDYKKSYEQIGKCLKHGVHADSTKRTKVAEHRRSYTFKVGDEQNSLEEYVDCKTEGQNDSSYITGESTVAASSAPFVEYMDDFVGEHAVQQIKEFDGFGMHDPVERIEHERGK